jgi:hypothetical protein
VNKRPLPLATTRSSSRRSSSRKGKTALYQRPNGWLLGATLCGASFIAALVGRTLDLRAMEQRALDESKASLSNSSVPVISANIDAQREVEKLSGVFGRPLLSLERWLPAESFTLHGVELGNMVSVRHDLRSSLARGYVFTSASLDAIWQRPDGFLDLSLGRSSNGSTLLRFSPDAVEAFFASRKNTLVSIEKTALVSRGLPCQRFDVVASERRLTVSCDGAQVISLPEAPTAFEGRVSVASNLTHGEVRDFVVNGRTRETELKDQR